MIGGDITYKCLGNNVFQITITLYQDCLNGEPQAIVEDDPAFYGIFTAGSNPTLVRNGSVFSSSKEKVDPNFNNECINNPPRTCLQKQVFIFNETLPPTTKGYYIVYQRCCRNASINNIVNPGNTGVSYVAEIPPFNAGECPNNSAVFKSMPPQIICVNNPFAYDFSALDADSDSLTYELCAAHPGGSATDPKPSGSAMSLPPYPSVGYIPPYSATMPVTGFPALTINAQTGLMTGNPTTIGRFVVSVCVKEWRNGVLINTLSRDIQFVITNCSKAVVADIPVLPNEPNTFKIQCQGYNVQFVNNSTGGFSYLWDFGVPGATSTEFEPNYTYPDTGIYKVKLIVNPGSTCPDSITRLVKVYPEFHADFSWTGKLCPGEEIQFKDSSFATFPPLSSWYWDFGDSTFSTEKNPKHTFQIPGGDRTVKLIAKSQLGCVDSVEKFFPLSYFNLFAGNDTIIVKDVSFSLNGSGSQFYLWEPPDYLSNPNIANPAVAFPGVGYYTYILKGNNDEGCFGEDTINIRVVDEGIVFVPTAFSPNADGLNDELEVKVIGYVSIKTFEIFNRFGQRVYYSTNTIYPKWDGLFNGKKADGGVYFWRIKTINRFGEEEIKSGDVTLLQ